ncbi:MAG TPA: transcriptional regulator [Devosiaceae bacterium]|jgi:DNA-binding transcriptional ArsR family regulator|nr:transcriptional regulator [Devosiaceae bacterium]
MTISHPDTDQIELANVLTALGDETRLAMIGYLALDGGQELACGQFYGLGSKTILSYHLAKLREAGVVQVRPEGTKRMISLRRADLDGKFPGFLDAVLKNAVTLAAEARKNAALEPEEALASD